MASPELRNHLRKLLYTYERWSNPSEIMEPSRAWEELIILLPKIDKLINKEIIEYDKNLNEYISF